jgi:hypothetical protein
LQPIAGFLTGVLVTERNAHSRLTMERVRAMRQRTISYPVTIPEKTDEVWTIWWDTQKRTERWSRAVAQTEAGALDRTQHFIKLGFFVYAIRDPSGALYLGEEDIATRFAGVRPVTQKEARQPSTEPGFTMDGVEDL